MTKKQKFDYFEAFCSQAQLAAEESRLLVDIFENYTPGSPEWVRDSLQKMHEIENRADQVCHDITDHLAVEFMPPIDREDVTDLALLFDEVSDKIEEVVQHLYMYDIRELHPSALLVARVINGAVQALAEATTVFREFKKPKKLNTMLVVVHDRESEGDALYIEAKRDIFTNHANDSAAYLIAWNSMFSHLEQCCDACGHVASVMQKVALKNA